jgi:2-dehydro-3-deoxygluconokinase
MSEIVTFGETMAVMAPGQKGKLSSVSDFSLQIAGAESNTAIGLSRLGHTASWISAVGDDELGRFVVDKIKCEGVDTSLVKIDNKHRTGLMIKEIVEDKTTVYYYRENSALSFMGVDDIPLERIKDAKIVHFTGITPVLSKSCRAAVLELMGWARENGKIISFDPNIRRKIWGDTDYLPLLTEMLEFSDIALLGLCEARELYGIEDVREIAKNILEKGVSIVVIKDGANGAYCANTEEFIFIPPIKCNPVDSVGAGDGFNAGFLAAVLENKSLLEAGRMGAVVGAMATETVGDVNGYPQREALEDRLSQYHA